ncbi:MAG TPA: hypothetical protein VM677_31685 [Actinokineospora sp.]|jgi:hypothetical protein|nr:hypothetical protein [Actinokineospora sp.]
MTATIPALDQVRTGGVERLAVVVDRVANAFADHLSESCCDTASPVSWLALPADPALAQRVLTDLCDWMTVVYLRYADAVAGLPECWLWHPDVVEELLWLSQAWHAAQRAGANAATQVGDWHDRYRPGVVRRIKAVAGTCSVENHQSRPDHTPPAASTPPPAAVALIAHWWGAVRVDAAPEPTADHLQATGHESTGRTR